MNQAQAFNVFSRTFSDTDRTADNNTSLTGRNIIAKWPKRLLRIHSRDWKRNGYCFYWRSGDRRNKVKQNTDINLMPTTTCISSIGPNLETLDTYTVRVGVHTSISDRVEFVG